MARVLTVDPHHPEPAAIAEAAALLRAGGLVAFPTETVYGLGADALRVEAVARIFEAKGRPANDPIIVHVLDADAMAAVAATVPPMADALARAFWPGPLTLVVPRGANVPEIVTAGLGSVAVRAPAHPVARALLAAARCPVAAPSANPFGRASPTTAGHVIADLGDRVDMVLDAGATTVGVESTVLDCLTDPPVVLRPGGVTLEALAPWSVQLAAPAHGDAGAERSPGRMVRHYAPSAPLVLVAGPPGDVRSVLALAARRLVETGLRVGLLCAEEDLSLLGGLPPGVCPRVPGPLAEPEVVARRLFEVLRALDADGVDAIVARDFGRAGLALAVRDRLTRAAEGRVVTVASGECEAAAGEVVRRVTRAASNTASGAPGPNA